MTVALLPLDPSTHRPHPLHGDERIWSETNCYVDLWVEVLHALGLDPLAGAAFTLSTDFEGDQWTFSKYPPEDLRRLYGIEVGELNVWRPLRDHVAEQLALGRLLTVEVDAWYLPDTAGVSYRSAHVKTTIVPNLLDVDGRRLGYFHNAGYFELDGDDFDGVLLDRDLPPYVELVRLERMRREVSVEQVRALAAEHLGRRPDDNPVARLRKRVAHDLPWLSTAGIETFHEYAFGTCRQCGAAAELAASFVDWLAERGEHDDGDAAGHLRRVAETAKTLQFQLARAARGRPVDVDGPLTEMERDWDAAIGALVARHGD